MPDPMKTEELLRQLFDTGELPGPRAAGILDQGGGVQHLGRLTAEELAVVTGLEPRTARRIAAALQLGRMSLLEGQPHEEPLLNSRAVYGYLLPRVGWPEVEEFWVLALDVRQRPIHLMLVARGSSHEVNLTLASLFRLLIRSGAPRGICCHTHPSGDPAPSDIDLTLTDRIVETAGVLGLEIMDHLILGQGSYVSLADKGYI